MATPRSTASARPATLNVDTLEREDGHEPFVIKIDGKNITLTDIAELDWQVAATLSPDRPHDFFEKVIPEDQQEHFLAAKVPLWKMRIISQGYNKHYGIPDAPN